jgi:transposase
VFPFIELIYGDGGYQGPKVQAAVAATGAWRMEIVKRTNLHRFVVLSKRWIVERADAISPRRPSPNWCASTA